MREPLSEHIYAEHLHDFHHASIFGIFGEYMQLDIVLKLIVGYTIFHSEH
jgi:hypothetical protein